MRPSKVHRKETLHFSKFTVSMFLEKPCRVHLHALGPLFAEVLSNPHTEVVAIKLLGPLPSSKRAWRWCLPFCDEGRDLRTVGCLLDQWAVVTSLTRTFNSVKLCPRRGGDGDRFESLDRQRQLALFLMPPPSRIPITNNGRAWLKPGPPTALG